MGSYHKERELIAEKKKEKGHDQILPYFSTHKYNEIFKCFLLISFNITYLFLYKKKPLQLLKENFSLAKKIKI